MVNIMRSRFDEQLKVLNKKMIEMGAECEELIALVAKALLNGDVEGARKAKEQGHEIDQMEREIEAICLKLLLQQQPVAKDLRVISAALKMITDMERIGDIADDITIHSVMLKESRSNVIVDEAVKMGRVAVSMLKSSINAYVSGDVELALNSCREDDIIDDLFDTVMKQLVEMIKTDAKGADEAPDLLMITKYFERMGDHTVNIAEWVVYAYTGTRNIDLDSEKGIDEALSCIL